jgi:hypothetical protein
MPNIMLRIGSSLLLLIALSSCGTHQLKQAQDSFNEAARIESTVSLEDTQATGDPLTGDSQALNNYRVALALTDEALSEYADSLRSDQLYGTALMLKALSQWRIAALAEDARLEDVQQLVDDVERRAQSEDIVLGTRDQVLLKALPGLYEHELALSTRDPGRADTLFSSAVNTLENSLEEVNPPADHPVRIYIRLAQLRIVRAWRWSQQSVRPEDLEERTEWNRDWNTRYKSYRDKLAPFLETNPGLRQRVEQIDKDFGFNPS